VRGGRCEVGVCRSEGFIDDKQAVVERGANMADDVVDVGSRGEVTAGDGTFNEWPDQRRPTERTSTPCVNSTSMYPRVTLPWAAAVVAEVLLPEPYGLTLVVHHKPTYEVGYS
jgi:hypothetical protein